jgi:hypothetical protein
MILSSSIGNSAFGVSSSLVIGPPEPNMSQNGQTVSQDSVASMLLQGVQQAYEAIVHFGQRDDFTIQMAVAFGERFDSVAADRFFASLVMGSGVLPRVEVLEDSILGRAFGVYVQTTDTVYLSRELLSSGDIDAITGVLIEEFGHGIDARVNMIDAAGDEGDIFKRIVRRVETSISEIADIKSENDFTLIQINNNNYLAEKSESDIVWRNSKSGETHIWKMNSNTMTRQSSAILDVVPEGTGWSVAGTGDFDGDGDSDVLWRNSKSGETHIWKMNSNTMTRQSSAILDVVPESTGWSVAGTGDFDGDGDSDILWRNSKSGETHIWKINASTMTRQSSAFLDVIPESTGWSVAGTGDFDGDGDSDILWRNSKSGETHIWKMNSNTMTRQSSAFLDVIPVSTGWSVSGIGNFDGDGDSDILWRNSKSGETHIWKINANTMTRQSSAFLDIVHESTGWKVSQIEDFDRDGDSDVLWRNSKSGETHIWKINANTMTRQSSTILDVVPEGTGWSVVGFVSSGKTAVSLTTTGLPTSASGAVDFFRLQFNHPKWNPTGPNSSSNCGPASLSMLMSTLGIGPKNVSAETLIDHARYLMNDRIGNGEREGVNIFNQDGAYTDWSQLRKGITNAGGTAQSIDSWTDLDENLSQGCPAVVIGYYNQSWKNQFPDPSLAGSGNVAHFVTVLGRTKEGNYIVADPMYKGGPVEMTKFQLSKFFYSGQNPVQGDPKGLAFRRS